MSNTTNTTTALSSPINCLCDKCELRFLDFVSRNDISDVQSGAPETGAQGQIVPFEIRSTETLASICLFNHISQTKLNLSMFIK